MSISPALAPTHDIPSEDTSLSQLQMLQASTLHLDNLYPYTRAWALHSVPSAGTPSGALLPDESEHQRVSRHLDGKVLSSLYTLRSSPDTCIVWRILGDKRTLELRTLRWVDEQTSTEGEGEGEGEVASWRFDADLVGPAVVADGADGAVSVFVCVRGGTVYRLRFASAWEIARTQDVGRCTRWHSLRHAAEPTAVAGSGRNAIAVAFDDGAVAWLEWHADGAVSERLCTGGSAAILPRVAAFLLRRDARLRSPVALDVCDGVAATLGRDRRLRLWTQAGGCVLDEPMPQLDADGAELARDDAPEPLLATGACVRMQQAAHGLCILVFVPDDASPYFAVLAADAHGSGARTVLRKVCRAANGASALMADDALVDARLLAEDFGQWTLWALWDRAGDAVATHTRFSLDGAAVVGERWFAALPPPPALQPSAQAPEIDDLDRRIDAGDASLAAAEVARVFLDHVLHPVRFDRGVVAHALRL
ncbi:hypothetical protein LPJ66_011781, partial [Kickxella alabastrina]